MLKTKTQKIVTTGLLLAIGILLPFVLSHGFILIPGNIILPMHIPVLLCGFFCGPLYGAALGFILPYLNSALTSMPVLYPNAIVMSGELLTYGLMTALMHKCTKHSTKPGHIYLSLIPSMIAGRIVYGIMGAILLGFNPSLKKLSAVAALIQGIPGIIIQLILIPVIIIRVSKAIPQIHSAEQNAVKMIKDGVKTCVVVKGDKIVSAESPLGIYHIINLYEAGVLKNTFVADTVIGKAAAMIFTLAGVKRCYGQVMSKEALKWLESHKIDASYGTLSENIINRKGDGICPMEETVIDIDDEKTAIVLLKAKVEELKSLVKQED